MQKISYHHDLQSNYHFQPVAMRPLVCMASPLPLFWVVLRRNLLMCLATPGSASGSIRHQRLSLAVARGNTTSILACVQVWSNFPVLFLAAFDVLTTTTAYHLPLYQDSMNVCVAIAFRILILILSIRLIVPAWPMLRVQRGFVFNIALNLWLRSSKNFILFEKKKMSSVTQKSWKNGANLLSTSLPHYMLQYSPSLPSSASHTQLITQQ